MYALRVYINHLFFEIFYVEIKKKNQKIDFFNYNNQ